MRGAISLGPNRNINESNKVYSIDEDEDENLCLVIPHTPYLEKFFAIAM